VAVVTPLNNFLGPEGDTVTMDEQLLNTEYSPTHAMAHIPPPSRVPYDPSLYASAGSMADFYDEPMYAAAPHPTVPLFRGAVPARVLASTPGNMGPASTAGDGLGFFSAVRRGFLAGGSQKLVACGAQVRRPVWRTAPAAQP
jgi:hypothetical protein